jgi:hypothetical protein
LDYLDQTYLSPVDTPMLCGIMASIVQIFYAYRIYALRRSLKWVSVFIIATSITQTTAAIYAAGKVGRIAFLPLEEFIHTVLAVIRAWKFQQVPQLLPNECDLPHLEYRGLRV